MGSIPVETTEYKNAQIYFGRFLFQKTRALLKRDNHQTELWRNKLL